MFFSIGIVLVGILYCLEGQLKWHCGPNLAHGPVLDTYDLQA